MLSSSVIPDDGKRCAIADPLARHSVNLVAEATNSPASSAADTSSEDQASTQGSDESSDDPDNNPLHVAETFVPKTNGTSGDVSDTEYLHPMVYCEIPDGVEIRPNSYGQGIFVTKHFRAGEIIYTGRSIMVEDRAGKIPLKTSHGGEYLLDVQTHTVKQWDDNMRQLYAFDSFMNHSCDPTSESILLAKDSAEQIYHQVAVKNMAPGDEVTCDYTLFEYDCPDKAIYQCACGSEQCLGTVLGFKYLTDAEKLQRLPKTDLCVVDAWLRDCPDIVYFDLRKTIPAEVDIVPTSVNDDGRLEFKMMALRDFAPGEVIFSNQSVFVQEGQRVLVTIASRSFFLNPIEHTINRGDGKREFFGFDSFMNHSCDPNSDMAYITETSYSSVARNPINMGEEVTCDYETFDDGLDGSVFECWCGAANCRKYIKG